MLSESRRNKFTFLHENKEVPGSYASCTAQKVIKSYCTTTLGWVSNFSYKYILLPGKLGKVCKYITCCLEPWKALEKRRKVTKFMTNDVTAPAQCTSTVQNSNM